MAGGVKYWKCKNSFLNTDGQKWKKSLSYPEYLPTLPPDADENHKSGMVRLLNVVNSLERPICQVVTRRWEALCADLPPNTCMYTVSMDPPQMQARWQDTAGVLHQALSAHRSQQFGQDYGVWLKEWRQLARAVFVIDRHDRIVYIQYVADQRDEPEYAVAMEAVQRAAWE
jgi:thioredoxin-dependent peroxiredoxin